MDEKSVWKKEISFRRKPKAPKVPVAPGEQPKSMWKKEISFKRKEKPAVVKTEQQPATKQSIWKKEITLGRKSKPAEPKAETISFEPVVPSEPVVEAPAQVGPEPVVVEAHVEPEPVVVEAHVEPEPVVVEAHVEPEPVVVEAHAEPAPEVVEPAPEVADQQEPAHEESWESAPEVPPEPIDVPSAEPVLAEAPTVEVAQAAIAQPAAVVHPPVPAAELPPLPEEREEKPAPLWRREIVFGRRKESESKSDAPAKTGEPKAEKPKKQKAPKAQKAPKVKVDRGGKGKKIIGLKIGASQLAAARVTNNGVAELLQVAREPLSPGIVVGGELRDPDALAVALKDFFNKYKLPKRGVRLGIANNRIGVRTFEIGGIQNPKQLDNAIRFRAQEALPIPIDEAVLDYQVLGETTDDEGQQLQRVLLVVAYREQIDRYVDACKKAGIVLLGIDLEAFALLRALQAPQIGAGDDPSAALVAVAIGHERSTFAVSDGRVCEFTRVLEWGGHALNVAIARTLDAAPSEVEAVKRTLSLSDEVVPEGLTPEQAGTAKEAVRRAIQTFARELVSSLQFYQNQPGSLGIGEIVLTGGTTHLPGLANELERLIGVHVRVGDPLARIKVSKRVGEPDQLGSYSVAIGLGIED